jgi:hypothetical protein
MALTTPRVYHTQQIHYLRKTVNYNDAGIAGGVIMGTLPSGAQIVDIVVNVKTAFNAATTNNLLLGTSAAGNQIATTTDTAAGTAGFKRVTTGGALTLAADTDVYVAYTQTGTAASAGVATIVIAYAPDNDK